MEFSNSHENLERNAARASLLLEAVAYSDHELPFQIQPTAYLKENSLLMVMSGVLIRVPVASALSAMLYAIPKSVPTSYAKPRSIYLSAIVVRYARRKRTTSRPRLEY